VLLRRHLVQKEKHWAGGKQFYPWPLASYASELIALGFHVQSTPTASQTEIPFFLPWTVLQESWFFLFQLCIRTCLHCGFKHVWTHVCVTTDTLHLCWITYTITLGTISKLCAVVHQRVKKHGRFFILFLKLFFGGKGWAKTTFCLHPQRPYMLYKTLLTTDVEEPQSLHRANKPRSKTRALNFVTMSMTTRCDVAVSMWAVTCVKPVIRTALHIEHFRVVIWNRHAFEIGMPSGSLEWGWGISRCTLMLSNTSPIYRGRGISQFHPAMPISASRMHPSIWS
jgi:hypothetical protein